MQQPTLQQLCDQKTHATRGVEMVHIGRAVGIDPGQQWHHSRKFGEVVPVDEDASRTCHRHQMQSVVGRAAGGQQTDDAIGHSFGINLVAHANIRLAECHRALHTSLVQGLAQWCVRIHKAGAGQLQAHDFHQHLVRIGRAIKGAGARTVVGRLLGFHERGAAHQALCKLLAHLGLVVVRQATGHRACRQKQRRQMAKLQSTHEHPGHDLVANAQQQDRVKHVVRQTDCGGHGNHITREQRQAHAVFALGDAVAHGWHT